MGSLPARQLQYPACYPKTSPGLPHPARSEEEGLRGASRSPRIAARPKPRTGDPRTPPPSRSPRTPDSEGRETETILEHRRRRPTPGTAWGPRVGVTAGAAAAGEPRTRGGGRPSGPSTRKRRFVPPRGLNPNEKKPVWPSDPRIPPNTNAVIVHTLLRVPGVLCEGDRNRPERVGSLNLLQPSSLTVCRSHGINSPRETRGGCPVRAETLQVFNESLGFYRQLEILCGRCTTVKKTAASSTTKKT